MKSFVLDLFGGAGHGWKPTVSLVGVMVLAVGLLTIASAMLISWQHGLARAENNAVAEDPAPDVREASGQPTSDLADGARAKLRCPECGVIQSIRASEATGGMPAVYETTIRFGDGSTRVLAGNNLAHWRIGEHITFIGGPASQRR